MHEINIRTRSRVDFQDITQEVQNAVQSSGVRSGVCYVFIPHTTAGITLNEHADPSVAEDISEKLEGLVPQHNKYHHREGNAPAHIKASLMGNSAVILIEEGQLVLGTWQGVFLCEFDGPRNRRVLFKITPDRP